MDGTSYQSLIEELGINLSHKDLGKSTLLMYKRNFVHAWSMRMSWYKVLFLMHYHNNKRTLYKMRMSLIIIWLWENPTYKNILRKIYTEALLTSHTAMGRMKYVQ